MKIVIVILLLFLLADGAFARSRIDADLMIDIEGGDRVLLGYPPKDFLCKFDEVTKDIHITLLGDNVKRLTKFTSDNIGKSTKTMLFGYYFDSPTIVAPIESGMMHLKSSFLDSDKYSHAGKSCNKYNLG